VAVEAEEAMSDRPTILLVDDDAVLVEALRAVLEQHYRVLTAHSGEEAVAVVSDELPDLIILDVMMSYLSEGYDLAAMFKKSDRTAGVPIVILTGVDRMFEARSRLEKTWVEVESFMTKPPDFEKLHKTVESLLGARSKR
jgi:CheY-like chemotaxis protein